MNHNRENEKLLYSSSETNLNLEISSKLALKKIGNSNFYWKKFGMILLIELAVILVLLFKGGKGIKSIIGAEKCTFLSNLVLLGYGLLSSSFFILSLFIVTQEETLRT